MQILILAGEGDTCIYEIYSLRDYSVLQLRANLTNKIRSFVLCIQEVTYYLRNKLDGRKGILEIFGVNNHQKRLLMLSVLNVNKSSSAIRHPINNFMRTQQ